MIRLLADLVAAAQLAAGAPHLTTLEVKEDGVHVLVRGRANAPWPGLPMASELVDWAAMQAGPRNAVADVIGTLNQRLTDLVAERLQQEGKA